jgi:flagellar biosynthesis protein FliR
MPVDAEGLFAVFGPFLMSFTLVAARIGALNMTTPLLSASMVPMPVKAGLVGSMAILVMITLGPAPHIADLYALGLAAAVL